MTVHSSFRYDVAFSLLSKDLGLAEQLSNDLQPALAPFVYSRKKEELLGGDGMDQFAAAFGEESRLSVILHRDGWGETPWTAFEQSHIKDRALATRMTSFLVIKLDDSELPSWVPDTHIYVSTAADSHADIIAVIRYRARQQGAVLRRENSLDVAQRLRREQHAKQRREQRQGSSSAVNEVGEQVQTLFKEIVRLVDRIRSSDPAIEIDAASRDNECGVTRHNGSLSLVWLQPYGNNLNESRLRVNDWGSRIVLPRNPAERTGGPKWDGARHYRPELSEDDEWIWRYDSSLDEYPGDDGSVVFFDFSPGETYRTSELADHLLKRYFERVLRSG